MLHDSANILGEESSSTSIIKEVCFIGQEAKGNACQYFEVIKGSINLALHTRIIVKSIMVEVTKLRNIPLQGRTSKWRSNIDFHEGNILKRDKALKALYKEYDIPIIDVFFYQNYLAFFVCSIKIRVKVTQIDFISPFC